jgi:Peptidase family M50
MPAIGSMGRTLRHSERPDRSGLHPASHIVRNCRQCSRSGSNETRWSILSLDFPTGLKAAQWVAENLKDTLIINVVLAVFNMFPIPPLDGGRIAVGVFPDTAASPLARLEPYGMFILVGLLFILPMVGAQLGVDLSIVSRVIASATDAIIGAILRLTGIT